MHDEKLFAEPPLPQFREDCPICFLRLPSIGSGSVYMSCCGKVICSGCRHAPVYDNQGNEVTEKKCPFCRSPLPDSDEGIVERYKKRVEANDVIAIHTLGSYYRGGLYGLSIDHTKALELWHRATELGYAGSYTCIGFACYYGQGVEIDKKKAFHYWELAAIGGDLEARTNLGTREEKSFSSVFRGIKLLKRGIAIMNRGHNLYRIEEMNIKNNAFIEDS